MAKRELSSTLKNLKFMQRNAIKEDKAMEVVPLANAIKEDKPMEVEPFRPVVEFGAPPASVRRCIVIMEGEPRPGALTGRMSFQNFNPYVDKLNEEAAKKHQNVPHTSDIGGNSERVDAVSPLSSRCSRGGGSKNVSDVNLKRKESDEATDRTTSQSSRKISGPNKQQKRENLDWKVLRPPKSVKKG